MAQRLSHALLEALKERNQTASGERWEVALPGYDATSHQPGIVHLGLGAFSRAHLAHYTESVLEVSGGDWRIVGVSLRNAGVADQLLPQNGLYTLVEQGGDLSGSTERFRVLSAVSDVLIAPNDPTAVIKAMQPSAVRIVSLTVTEKGYCHDPASGELRLTHPDIVWDLANLDQPRTAVGFVVAGLAARFANNQSAFTPLSLDNLPNNGGLLKHLVLSFAGALDTKLAQKIAQVEFPSTMVDRIVPATTDADRADLTAKLGYIDNGMVKAEPYTQWVIEDRFPAGRPDWNLAGALFVKDVAPFETMKLRLLNGSHSAIAYLGVLAGYDFVHQVIADNKIERFIAELMVHELAPTLVAPEGILLPDYQAELLERFNNPALAHRTLQIAMDGSQKLPQRILAPLRERIASGKPCERLALVVAAWLLFVERELAAGGPSSLSDPLAAELYAVVQRYPDNVAARIGGYLQVHAVFGADLSGDGAFQEQLCFWFCKLRSDSVAAVLEQIASD